MSTWISKDGVWTPAKERVVTYDKDGRPEIYEGPDRSALNYLKEAGEDHLGMPFWEDSDIIERAHDKKMTIEEFTKQKIYTKEKREEEFKKKESVVNYHVAPKRNPETLQKQTGGTNTAGTGHLYGGFSEGNQNALDEAVKKVVKK